MNEYPKIQTVYLRDPETNFKTLLEGQWATPEFKYLKRCDWVWTEKVDGTNIRVMWDGKELKFAGKTDKAQIPPFLFDELNRIFSLQKQVFKEIFGYHDDPPQEVKVCLYGEGYGAKIQKGGGNYIPDGCSFVLFDAKVGNWWLKRDALEDIADKLQINIVPVVGTGTLREMVETAKGLLISNWAVWKNQFQAEGLVGKPIVDLFDRQGKRVITKIKCKDFKI